MKAGGQRLEEMSKQLAGLQGAILAQRASTKENVEQQIEHLKDHLGKAERLRCLLTEHPEIAEAIDLLVEIGRGIY